MGEKYKMYPKYKIKTIIIIIKIFEFVTIINFINVE